MKWYVYVICFVLICVGTLCGIQLYREVKAESYINGSIDISNKFSQENFNYTSTSVTFYHDIYDKNNTYSFEKELLKVDNFNGQKNTYELWLNNFILLDTEYNAGSVYSTAKMDFYNEYNQIVCNSVLKISIKYLSSKTTLTLSTSGEISASFLTQYFADNGIRLKVLEIL